MLIVFLICILVVAVPAIVFRNPNARPAPVGGVRHEAGLGTGQIFPASDTLAVFEQPQNAYRERVPRRAWLWMLLFGIFYMMARQLWMHVAIVAVVIVGAIAIDPWLLFWIGIPVWIFYVRRASDLLIANYYRRGWKPVAFEDATFLPEVADGSL